MVSLRSAQVPLAAHVITVVASALSGMAGRVDAVLVVTIDLAKGLCLLDIMATTVLYASCVEIAHRR